MNAEQFKEVLITEIIEKGCTISRRILENNFDTLISQVKVDLLTYQLERKKDIDIIGQHIIEPLTDEQL